MPRRWRLLVLIGSISILADQITKFWARSALADGPHVVIEGYWDHVLAFNTGAAFSMFSEMGNGRIFLAIVAAVAIAAIVSMVHKAEDHQTGFVVALSLMAGGAIGNIIDRIAFGKVTDFVLWKYNGHKWPVFNIADVVLLVAVGLFLIVAIKDWKLEKATKESAEKEGNASSAKA